MADTATEPAIEAIAKLVPATLRVLYALEFAARHLSPDTLARLIEAIADRHDDVEAALVASRAIDWPERLAPVRDSLERAAAAAAEANSATQVPAQIDGNAEARPRLTL